MVSRYWRAAALTVAALGVTGAAVAQDLGDIEVPVLYGTWHENKVGIYDLQPGAYTMRCECIGASALARMLGKSFTYVGTRVLDVERAGQPAFDMALDGISLRRLPWGQRYRYAEPGTRNRAGFDLWSVHGDERRPAGWIGNWGERSDQ